MSFEVCTGSVGHLENEDVVKNFLESCAGNRQESIEVRPELKLIIPTLRDAQKSNLGLPNNISSHIDWRTLPEKGAEYLSTLFHHYHSKDPGTLFHSKIYVALHADDPKRTPLYLCMGSANISSSVWGVVKSELRNGVITKSLATERLERVANFECGVVIKGRDIVGCWRRIGGGISSRTVVRPRLTCVKLILATYPRREGSLIVTQRYKEGETSFRVSKHNVDALIDQDGDDFSDEEKDEGDDDEAEFGTHHSMQDLVRLPSKKPILRLFCKA
ncbi:hypothetical protein C8F04DRAFT_1192802 [Mycena alexandri]|uniref:Tyrosyl-DNA phosphodiesterase 1 n=1 Tax=Mycena alexandri TaxID=1745969 RepID=A0AAD6WT80_9AGAR|nr:hypothetical protein C8F04DRAFT_1192802 [Mycena alexandri]